MNGHLIFRDPFALLPHSCDPSALPEHPDPTPVGPCADPPVPSPDDRSGSAEWAEIAARLRAQSTERLALWRTLAEAIDPTPDPKEPA